MSVIVELLQMKLVGRRHPPPRRGFVQRRCRAGGRAAAAASGSARGRAGERSGPPAQRATTRLHDLKSSFATLHLTRLTIIVKYSNGAATGPRVRPGPASLHTAPARPPAHVTPRGAAGPA